MFPEEKKVSRKGTRGTRKLLYIHQHHPQGVQKEMKNGVMAWIDCKKTYDIVPQNWIMTTLKCASYPTKSLNFIEKIMKNLSVEGTARGKNLVEVKIQRGVFQGEALLPLLFAIAMMPLNHILRKCTVGYNLTKSQEKIIHLMYMDDIKYLQKIKKNGKS